jgi:DNA repair exonuclease SbcCD nuclease subunit
MLTTILFMADLHIKLGQKNVPKEWSLKRYAILWEEIKRIAQLNGPIDYLILGGDTFDKAPSMEELGVFLDMLKSLDVEYIKKILIYSGNHEAVKKETTFLTWLAPYLGKYQGVTIVDEYISYREFDILPYNRLKQLTKVNPQNKVLFTHVRGEIPPHVQPEVDLSLFDPWEIVFAGDLHSKENSQRNIVYPGSPVSTSFHRNHVDTGIVLVTIMDSMVGWEWKKLEVPQLIRKTVSSPEEMVKTDYDHTIYELEGSMEDLAKLTKTNSIDNTLLDKKLVQKVSEPTLNLSKATSIQEELSLYLKEVLNISDEKIRTLQKELNDIT